MKLNTQAVILLVSDICTYTKLIMARYLALLGYRLELF